jgi:hypothetical protein
MVRWSRGLASLLVVFGVLASSWATCTAGTMMPDTVKMACCKAGHHTCGHMGAATDCCKKVENEQGRWTALKTEPVKPPVLVALALAPSLHAALPPTLLHAAPFANASPPPPSGAPIYIVNSVLLI